MGSRLFGFVLENHLMEMVRVECVDLELLTSLDLRSIHHLSAIVDIQFMANMHG